MSDASHCPFCAEKEAEIKRLKLEVEFLQTALVQLEPQEDVIFTPDWTRVNGH